MMKRFAPLALLLPVAACGTAGSSENSRSQASDLTSDGGAITGTNTFCSCFDGSGHPSNSSGGSGGSLAWQCSQYDKCPDPVSYLTIAPGQEGPNDVGVVINAGLNWPDPANVSFSISGLPQGVTAQLVQISPYIPPAQGIVIEYEFNASPSAPLGSSEVVIQGTSGGQTQTTSFQIQVTGTCTTPITCDGHCGAVDNGCSTILQCGGCPFGYKCQSEACVHSCPAGTHDCGDGTCSRGICQ